MTLLDRDPNAPDVWLGDLPVTSRYTYGLAGERFFRAIKDQARIYGTYCSACDHTYVPATLFCERCLGELDRWVDVGISGQVHTFTLLYQNYDGSPKQVPEIIAFIRLGDGGIIHHIAGIDPFDMTIDLKVEAVFKPTEERTGSILDITHFQPNDD